MNRTEATELILDWVRSNSRHVPAGEIDVDTPLIQRGAITSLQIADLILYIEQAGGRRIDPARLSPGIFRSVASIVAGLLVDESRVADARGR